MAKIGIDATPLQKLHGGISYYIFYILDELIQLRPNDTFYLFVDRKTEALQYFKKYPNIILYLCPNYSLGHSIWSQTFLAWGCFKTKIDLFWGPTQSIPLLKRKSMKTLLTQHDFVYLLHPETTPLVSQLYFRLFSRQMLKKANGIIAVSKGTGAKLTQFYGLQPHAIIEPPLKPLLYNCSNLTDKEYIVTVGTLEPRKNLQQLLETYIKTLQTTPLDQVLPLVIIGSGGWKNKHLLKTLDLAKTTYPTHIRPVGYVADDTLANLLTGAHYCIMMSKYEGYGMPLAEARMCRTMIICSDQPELREAAENDGIFLSSMDDAAPYFLKATQTRQPMPTYPSNRDKALRLSKLIEITLDA